MSRLHLSIRPVIGDDVAPHYRQRVAEAALETAIRLSGLTNEDIAAEARSIRPPGEDTTPAAALDTLWQALWAIQRRVIAEAGGEVSG